MKYVETGTPLRRCDGCKLIIQDRLPPIGWVVREGKDLCPTCAEKVAREQNAVLR